MNSDIRAWYRSRETWWLSLTTEIKLGGLRQVTLLLRHRRGRCFRRASSMRTSKSLFCCSDEWPSLSDGQCASRSAARPHFWLGHWLSESSSLLPMTKVRRIFHSTSRSSESRDHSLTAMASVVDENKHNSDQTAEGPWCFLDRRRQSAWEGIRHSSPFLCYKKHWSISDNIPIVVGTIPLLPCIPVLSEKKAMRRRARLHVFHTATQTDQKGRESLSENVLFGTFRSKPVQQASYRPGRSISSLSATSYGGHSARPRACGPRATLVTYTYAVADKELISRPDGR